ncbi:hypothetical protein JCM8208_002270 [Rhodotorula glutinis]
MSNHQTTDQDDDRPVYPLLANPSNPSSIFSATTPWGAPLGSHLSAAEQHAEYLKKQEEEEKRKKDEQEKGKDEEEDDEPSFYPVLSDPSNPNCVDWASSSAGPPLMTRLSPAEQHAEWLKKQEENRVAQDKAGQAAAAREEGA